MASEPRKGRGALFLPVTLAVCLLTLVSALAQTPRFRADVLTVTVSVTVADANGRLITGLTKDDFEIFEDGIKQPITQFSDQRFPVSLGIALDASDSMRGKAIVDACAAFDRFVGELLEPEDEAFAATFNHWPRLMSAWRRPPASLVHALNGAQPTGGTAIYDALAEFSPMFERRTNTRAAMVVISDGADTASDRTLQQAREVIRRSDAFVYAIAIDEPVARASTRVNPDALRDITGPSGGYTEVVHSAADLGPATARIADELNKQYTLGYTPLKPPEGTWRSIRVRSTRPDQFARSRRGYFSDSIAKQPRPSESHQ